MSDLYQDIVTPSFILTCFKVSPSTLGVLPAPIPGLDVINEETALDSARRWLGQCRDHHRCGAWDRSALPTRVVSVGTCDSDVRLVVPGSGASDWYLCLSHCWGGDQPLCTTTGNLQAHQAQIPWHRLPKTFQEAICFTRRLGESYIWIDSLCIVQDDPADWLAESTKMADVYRNAVVTLAATAGRSGRDSIYRNVGERVSYTTESGNLEGARFRFNVRHALSLRDAATGGYESRIFPLLTRAWVFQERLLSPRFLHFGPEELFWECREEKWCECATEGAVVDASKFVKRGMVKELESGSTEAVQSLWRDLVEQYSGLDLTRSSDRLPAIDGLASVVALRRPGAVYAGGMFTDSIPVDLMWVARSEPTFHLSSGRPLIYPKASYRETGWRAPSWSWASVDADVLWPMTSRRYYDRHPEDRVELLFEAEVFAEELNACLRSSPADGMRKPTLRLTGDTFPAVLHVDIASRGEKTRLEVGPGTRRLFSGLPEFVHPELDLLDLPDYIQLDDPEELVRSRKSPHAIDVVCVKMGTTERRVPDQKFRLVAFEYTMILAATTTPGGREYRRAGAAIYMNDLDDGPVEKSRKKFRAESPWRHAATTRETLLVL